MHKKLFTAVLALGLLLVANSVAFALSAPAIPGEKPVQAFGGNASKAGMTPTAQANPDPLVNVNAGQNRTVPGTFSNGQWQNPFAYSVGGWYVGNEFYAAIQDPSSAAGVAWGAGGPILNSPSFDVTAINTIERYSAGPFPMTFAFQPLVMDPGPAGCTFDGVGPQPAPVAGGAHCAGPLYGITWTIAASFAINLPFPVECCISGPYYAAYYAPTAGALRLGCDDGLRDTDPVGPVCGDECKIYNEYGAGWDELTGNYFGCFNLGATRTCNALNHILYSEGYTPDDPATHCNAGACAEDFWFDDAAAPDFAFGLPTGTRDRLGVWDDATGLDTLNYVVFAMNGPAPAVPADLTIEIYDGDDGVPVACSGLNPSYPGTLLYSQVVPAGSVSWGGYTVVSLSTPFVWGTLNGGPAQRIVVAIADNDPVGTTNGLLANNDDGACDGSDHFMARYISTTSWRNVFDVSGIAPEPFIALGICREVLPAQEVICGAGADDQWSSFAHDNRQTSASSLNIGNPNQVTLSWTRALPRISNFTNPTVANDIIYQSSDQEVNAYDLTTGAPVGTFFGAPEMGSSNRGNTTVATIAALGRPVVFATGGNFNSITALETNLETSPKIWSNNVGTFNIPNGLGAQNRFNASKVVTISGTDVLFVTTEPAAGSGRIYAFDAATGALYAGWGINPVVLDAAAKHGPAVNGGKLYVGTAIGGTNVDGSLYQIDAATGTVDWNFTGVGDPSEGWPSGVSTEGDFVYGATRDANNVGMRYKIDKSGALPAVVWSGAQGVGLYGTPTIGRGFVYFPLDNPSFGLLQIDKSLGLVSRNFASVDMCGASPFMIPQIVTLSCDSYLFAGDRNARWWLLNAINGEIEWYRQWPLVTGGEIVSGTALATYTVNGDDYAVVANRQLNGTVGQLSAYKLNAGPRPRLIQCKTDETVIVPLGSGPGNLYHVDDVFLSIGETPVAFSSVTITDPLPDGLSQASQNTRNYLSGVQSAAREYDGYNSIATSQSLTKRQRLQGLSVNSVDGEFTEGATSNMLSNSELLSVRNSSRATAASAAAIRTSNVLVGGAALPTSVAPGVSADLDWTYDGTGLGRGADANDLNFTTDDPDFTYDGTGLAIFHILYQGGCVVADDTLHFNSDGSYETVYNNGSLGDAASSSKEFNFGADANTPDADHYDGTLIVAGDSIAGGLQPDFGAQLHGSLYSGAEGFVPNVAPTSGACGFDVLRNIALGAKRTGGCPGTPVDIFGEMITHSMSDTTFEATAGSPCAAIGLDIVQTEVGAYDPLYGDFKMIHWAVTNRDAVAKGPIYLASQTDWDINSGNNTGLISDAFDGYALWDASLATIAYGHLDPNQPSTYSGVDPSANTPHKIWILSNPTDVYDPAPWDWGTVAKEQTIWSQLVNGGARESHGPAQEDKSGLLVNKPINLGPNGSASVDQVAYGVDASSNVAATITANAAALAKRAARWGGFARGDVNDDGVVDLADVCWLQGGNPIYPAAYSGDTDADGDNDAADVARLLSFVSGNAASRPAGAWRF